MDGINNKQINSLSQLFLLTSQITRFIWDSLGLFSIVSFHSNGVNVSIEYILEIHSIYPLFGSLMGGTRLTVSGSGFSNNTSDNRVSIGKKLESK